MNILKVLTARRITGNLGEAAAVKLLKSLGYRIVKKNYVAKGHEIDIIAEDGNYLVFVEVKSRTEGKESEYEPRPASSVTKEKMRGIMKAALSYSAFKRTKKQLRFDIIEVILKEDGSISKTEHLISAFTADRI